MIFYLGTHHPEWLDQTDVPLFVSRRQLARRKRLPVAKGPWALDSGGFTELATRGCWETTPERYASDVRRFQAEVGKLEWAAIQDWMCEPFVLKKTGLSVEAHQKKTIESYLRLRDLEPTIPWAPVLQGWLGGDYERHADAYERAGVDLAALPAVGVGSVCRRQNTLQAGFMLASLKRRGLDNLHGFGFKVQGLTKLVEAERTFGASLPFPLASADSLAWSYHARRERPFFSECTHKNCANCLRFALEWREELLRKLEAPKLEAQRSIFARPGS